MEQVIRALKLAKECTYADEMMEIAKEYLRNEIDEALKIVLPQADVSGSLPTEKEGEEYANSIVSNGVCDNEDELNIYRNGIEFGWKAYLDRIKGNDR